MGQEGQRSSEKCHLPLNGTSAGQPADCLVHNGLKDGSGDIRDRSTFINQGLDIGLGENPAAAGNGLNGLIKLRLAVQLIHINLKKLSHLIDESPGTPGADPIHPLFAACSQVGDLGILPP